MAPSWAICTDFGGVLSIRIDQNGLLQLTEYDLFSDAIWVGLANFKALLTDDLFLLSLANTIWFSLIVTCVQTVLALGLAIW